jgi:hypothetical protein
MPDITIARASNGVDYIVELDGVSSAHVVGRALLALIVAGASASHLSVYDASAGHYLTGTLDQLLEG